MKKINLMLLAALITVSGIAQITGKLDCPVNVSITIPNNSIKTVHIKDSAITQIKIAPGQVVKSLNGLKDDIKLIAGANVTISPLGNTLTISAIGGSSGGAGGPGFWNANGNHISNNNSGNVGIGITTPDSKLHIDGAVHINGPGTLWFQGGPSDPHYFLRSYDIPGVAGGMQLKGWAEVKLTTAAGDILNVINDKVGIGTTSPSHLLDVSGSGNEAGIHITNTANHASVLRFRKGSANKWGLFVQDGADDKLYFYDYISNQARMVLDQFGKVGIGTNQPVAKFHIKTTGTTQLDGIGIESAQAGGMILTMHQGVPGKLIFSKFGSPDNLMTLDFKNEYIQIGNWPDDRERWLTDHNIKLNVAGNFNVDGLVYYKGILLPQLPSDIRFKKEIEPISNAFQILDAINGIQFKWRTEEFTDMGFKEGTQFGVIAQEVEKVLPTAVSVMNDGYKTVDYTRLIPILIEAVKQQQQQIEKLQSQVDQLKKK